MGFSFGARDWELLAAIECFAALDQRMLMLEDSSECKTDPVVGRTTMCKSVKHFEEFHKGKLCGGCVVEFVKWVFHLRLAIGSCSSRLSVCSVGSEDVLILEDFFRVRDTSSGGQNDDVHKCEVF